MSSESPSGAEMPPGSEAQLASLIRDEGRAMIGVGVLLAILGVLAMIFPQVTSLSIGLFAGGALIVAGVVTVAHAFSAPNWVGALGEVILGIVFVVAGFFLLANPLLTLTTLTLLLVAYFVVEGFALLYFGWKLRAEQSWLWSIAAAAVTFLLAGLLWAGFPSTAAWALGLLFGINLLTTGVSMILVGRDARKAVESIPPAGAQPGAGA